MGDGMIVEGATAKLTDALKGVNGGYELNRLVGFIGGIAYVLFANAFVAYEVWWMGKDFDIVSYCLNFPIGLGVIVGGTAGAIAWKDRAVASAKITEQTGTIPAPPPDGPQTPAVPPAQAEQTGTEEEIPEYAR